MNMSTQEIHEIQKLGQVQEHDTQHQYEMTKKGVTSRHMTWLKHKQDQS